MEVWSHFEVLTYAVSSCSGCCQESMTALTWTKTVNLWSNMKCGLLFAYALSDLNLEKVFLCLLGFFGTDERHSCSLVFTDTWNFSPL